MTGHWPNWLCAEEMVPHVFDLFFPLNFPRFLSLGLCLMAPSSLGHCCQAWCGPPVSMPAELSSLVWLSTRACILYPSCLLLYLLLTIPYRGDSPEESNNQNNTSPLSTHTAGPLMLWTRILWYFQNGYIQCITQLSLNLQPHQCSIWINSLRHVACLSRQPMYTAECWHWSLWAGWFTYSY